MSLVIRLARTGKKGERKFRVIVKEKRDRRDGKSVELLGWYIKDAKGGQKQLNMERINHWLKAGAQPSATVKTLIKYV